ncbi:ABC transporter ATP-binding protein [Endozoicomonas sp. 8E]|uniref:ABC transporter ATP-binding protein n=1 Tax=Endozoicomonas sp. 8E TaxID=3035692 RepID=UPI0029395223|nr:ABC transporter transmembrane domain-containing protein [Endozoicomonas sp. 8E]WOG28796.1 ABC transporter transmembrane domain-containing protein [Endozoicomonas sp. 8E]
MLRYGLPYKNRLILSFTLLMIATAAGLTAPVIMKMFIDDHVVPGNWQVAPMVMMAFVFLNLYLLDAVMTWLETLLFQKVALAIVHDIRLQVFNHLFRLPMAYFEREPVGKLVSSVTNDTETIKDLFVTALPETLKGAITVVGVVIAMFLLNARLAWFCIAILPFILGCIYLYQKFSHPVFHSSRALLSEINTRVNESIQGMSVIQTLCQQKRVSEQFEAANREYKEVQNRLVRINGLLLRPMVHLASALALALMVGGFTGQALNGPIEIGLLYAFINYLDRMFEPLTQVTMQMEVLQQSVVSAERVFRLMDESVESGQESIKESLISKGKIEFREVELSYDGKNKALDGITFTAEPGQFIALVGHTGSGKSSIVNLLMRFYQYQSGQILIDGQPLSSFPEKELRQQLGLVFQEPFVFEGSIAENIHLGHEHVTEKEMWHAAQLVQAAEFIEKLPDGYAQVLGERGQSLSSGQKQLLSFARTLAQNPGILIMDEATANVDSETEQAIKQGLKTLREGRTTVAIAHRLTTIEDADQILVMEKGRIVQRGTHQQLLAEPGLYLDMYQSQRNQMEGESPLAEAKPFQPVM